jgi:hypothetical protein
MMVVVLQSLLMGAAQLPQGETWEWLLLHCGRFDNDGWIDLAVAGELCQ